MSISTFSLNGIEPIKINIEIHISSGIPVFIIVGLGDKAIAESKERVKSALASIGISLPAKRIIVNLSPANEPKEGTHYDLGIAIAILCKLNIISYDKVKNYIIIGELSLSGNIIPVCGIIAYTFGALINNMNIIVPFESYQEAKQVYDNILPVKSLEQLVKYFQGEDNIDYSYNINEENENIDLDFANIAGHDKAKRALEIAIAGGHHICMIGKPGSGKSMLAKATKSILPPLSHEEALEVSLIHSISGYNFVTTRPFRSPHHTSSTVSIIGGGTKCMPGEISLAHLGILFLDELPEFSKHVLESLRQPMEEYKIDIARANYKKTYMAKFQLIAAMNPCYCGTCENIECILKYQSKLSMPLKERFDITVQVNDFHYNSTISESSYIMKERIIAARKLQKNKLNGHLSGPEILQMNIANDIKSKLEQYCRKYQYSSRSYFRILRIALTISHLKGQLNIDNESIMEALSYHSKWIVRE